MNPSEPASQLFLRLRDALPRLEALLAAADRLHGRESVLGEMTTRMVEELRGLTPGGDLHHSFTDTVERWAEGTAPAHRRSLTNVFLQARFYLQLAVHCAKKSSPDGTPEVANLLRLFQLEP